MTETSRRKFALANYKYALNHVAMNWISMKSGFIKMKLSQHSLSLCL